MRRYWSIIAIKLHNGWEVGIYFLPVSMEMCGAHTEVGSKLNVGVLEKGSSVKMPLLVCNSGVTVCCGSPMMFIFLQMQ